MLETPSQVVVPPPPAPGSPEAAADSAELIRRHGERTPEAEAEIRYAADRPAVTPWIELTLDLVAQHGKNPPLAARSYALVSVAMHDAVVSASHWKAIYDLAPPGETDRVVEPDDDASYPSEHAAMAAAATRVLAYLYPELDASYYDRLANESADLRVLAGTNRRSDIDAGLALGREVAEAVIQHARSDGSEGHWARPWDGLRPPGPEHWEPPPGADPLVALPVEPSAGTWVPWIADLTAVRPAPPPEYGSNTFIAEALAVMDVASTLTVDQKAVATRWAGGAGSPLPPGIWNQIALDALTASPLTLPRQTSVMSLLNIAQADAGIAAWDCKYAYWSPRPINAIRDLGLDPEWTSFLPTPLFPSYVSGHATFSSAAATVLGYLLPDRAKSFEAMAREAALSRLYGGIHFPSDNDAGLALGRSIGDQVVSAAESRGMQPVS